MNYEVITCLRLSDWSPVVNRDNMHSMYYYSHVAQEVLSSLQSREEVLRSSTYVKVVILIIIIIV